jgi:glycosyltransferase involved in cell wall biosynthesis
MGTPSRIAFFPIGGDRTASARFRVFALAPFLEKEGFRVRVFKPVLGGRAAPARALDLMRDVLRAGHFDAVVVQRKTFPPPFDRWLRRRARRVVFDFDDAIFMPPPRLGGENAPLALKRKHLWNFRATLRACDAAVCGNAFLEAMATPFVAKTTVIPTGLDTNVWRPFPVRPSGTTLGWVGSADTLPYLEAILPALEKAASRRRGLKLRVVCDAPLRHAGSALRVENVPWSLAREREDFEGIDVGLMPLAEGKWERGKCAFKAAQYMALGIPVVASPVGENARLVRDGENGLLAATHEDWESKTEALLADPAAAGRLAAAGRETVERERSLAVLAPKWAALLRSLLTEEEPLE